MNTRSEPQRQRRRVPRKRANFTAPVTDAITRQDIGHLGDLSSGGLMLIGRQAPDDGAIYQLRFRLPGLDSPDSIIEVGVQALWYKPANAMGKVWSGYRIIAISDSDKAWLNKWLAQPA